MDFENFKVVGFEVNYHERLFLEAWLSTLDPNAGNDHIIIPEPYKALREHKHLTWSRAEASRGSLPLVTFK